MAKTLLAFLPLFAFYLAEAYWGLTAGVVVAMICAGAELVWQKARRVPVDRMVLFTSGLVLALGGLSLVFDDERFVLVSPVIGDVVFAAALLATVWGQTPLLVSLAKRQDPSIADDPVRVGFLRGMTWRLALNFLIHAGATVLATTQSRETWLFVSGPLQYILFGCQVAGEFAYSRLFLAHQEVHH